MSTFIPRAYFKDLQLLRSANQLEKVLYDLIRIAAQEIRIVYELFDFYTNYDRNLIGI